MLIDLKAIHKVGAVYRYIDLHQLTNVSSARRTTLPPQLQVVTIDSLGLKSLHSINSWPSLITAEASLDFLLVTTDGRHQRGKVEAGPTLLCQALDRPRFLAEYDNVFQASAADPQALGPTSDAIRVFDLAEPVVQTVGSSEDSLFGLLANGLLCMWQGRQVSFLVLPPEDSAGEPAVIEGLTLLAAPAGRTVLLAMDDTGQVSAGGDGRSSLFFWLKGR